MFSETLPLQDRIHLFKLGRTKAQMEVIGAAIELYNARRGEPEADPRKERATVDRAIALAYKLDLDLQDPTRALKALGYRVTVDSESDTHILPIETPYFNRTASVREPVLPLLRWCLVRALVSGCTRYLSSEEADRRAVAAVHFALFGEVLQ